MLKAYRIFNALSFDVALGACISAIFVASFLGVSLSIVTVLSLGTSVWLIYTVDHLMDAKQIDHTPHTFRHYFHQKHFKTIIRITFLVGLLQFLLLFYLPLDTLVWGVCLLFVVIIYFFLLWLLRFQKVYHKEILIALVYTSGIFLPAISILKEPLSPVTVLLFFQIMLLALSNLMLFSFLETSSDEKDKQASLAILLGNKLSKRSVSMLLGFGLILSLVLTFVAKDQNLIMAEIVLLMMNALLGLVLFLPSWRKDDSYRLIGDAVFYIPLVFIFLN